MLDLGWFGTINLNADFLFGFLSIILIDLILSGDNAVLIALAVRSLPHEKRIQGFVCGAGAAVTLRIILTFFAAQLLAIRLIKLLGGLFILWVAVKLLTEAAPEERQAGEARTLSQAIKIIVVADLIMSMDNVMAVAAASHGNLALLLFGLGLSIPLILGTSTLLSALMDRFAFIVYIGAAILGKVGGEMIINDPLFASMLQPTPALSYAAQGLSACGVLLTAKLRVNRRLSRGQDRRPGSSTAKSAGLKADPARGDILPDAD
jgi:YjbE family integral membrane protein